MEYRNAEIELAPYGNLYQWIIEEWADIDENGCMIGAGTAGSIEECKVEIDEYIITRQGEEIAYLERMNTYYRAKELEYRKFSEWLIKEVLLRPESDVEELYNEFLVS